VSANRSESLSRPARPRLLLVAYMYPDGGGIASIIENMAQTLEDYEVHLAVTVELEGIGQRLQLPADQVHTLGRTKLFRPTVMPFSLLYVARTARFLRGLVRQLAPEAVVTQDALFLPTPAALATRGTETKLVVLDHGILTNQLDPEWQRIARERMGPATALAYRIGFALDTPWRALRWRLGLRLADAAWYVGEELKPFFARAGDRAARHAPIIPPDFVPPTPRQRVEARQALDIADGTTVFNIVTRLDGEKGLDTLIEAIDRTRCVRDDFVVLVAGVGSLEDWMREEIGQRRLNHCIRMIGRLDRDEVGRLHYASDFHLYAGTISCAVSICLVEAMACQVVPIVSDLPAAQVQMVGNSGWVFSAGDTDGLVTAMLEGLNASPAERSARRQAVMTQLEHLPDPPFDRLLAQLLNKNGRVARQET
jgi:glycosyltransferase involved in cell wall biosynthesis